LLREIDRSEKGGRPPINRDGTDPVLTRTAAATSAGLSERQRKTAIAIAGIGADEFEAAIEAETPPTVTKLTEAGTAKRNKFCGSICGFRRD